jgi:hypothetical protein
MAGGGRDGTGRGAAGGSERGEELGLTVRLSEGIVTGKVGG